MSCLVRTRAAASTANALLRQSRGSLPGRASFAGVALSPTVRRLTDEEQANARYRGPVKAAILDWSGTVADAHVIGPAVAFLDAFKKHGVSISITEARIPMGLRKDLHIAKILEMPEVQERWQKIKGRPSTPTDVEEIFKDFVPLQVSCLRKYTQLIPGAVEAVDTLRSELGCKIGTTTGFTKVLLDVVAADAREHGYCPDSNVAGDEVRNDLGHRPWPFMLYENLLNMGVWPIHAVVKADDTVTGVCEGLNAGCWSVGIAGIGNYTNVESLEQWEALAPAEKEKRIEVGREKLSASGAHYVIDTIVDLPAVVRDINSRLANGERP